MSITTRLTKLVRDPIGVLKRRTSGFLELLRYRRMGDYQAEKYWQYRHAKYGFDLRGVGDFRLTRRENQRNLEKGSQLMLDLCKREGIDLRQVSMLDVGCGIGHYAQVFKDAGGTRYTGIDIVETLFESLRNRFRQFEFIKVNVSTTPIPGTYDLIILMDVAQHITHERKFRYAMENLKAHLKENGLIIISTIIGAYRRHTFYCVERPISAFESAFEGFQMSELLPFDTNKVFGLRRMK